MIRALLTILIIGICTSSFANGGKEALWQDFTKAHRNNDCQEFFKLLDKLIIIDPDKAYIEKAYSYEKGKCFPINVDKAIRAYQMVPTDRLDSMFALNLTHLLFMKAKNSTERKNVLSEVRPILFDEMVTVRSAEELEKYLDVLYQNSPDFLSALETHLSFFHSLDSDPSLKLSQVERFLEQGLFPELSENWLIQLSSKNIPRAHYLLAKNFEHSKSAHLRIAAMQGVSEAQVDLAKVYEREKTTMGYRFAYFWYLKAEQSGAEVQNNIIEMRSYLSKVDRLVTEEEALKESPNSQ